MHLLKVVYLSALLFIGTTLAAPDAAPANDKLNELKQYKREAIDISKLSKRGEIEVEPYKNKRDESEKLNELKQYRRAASEKLNELKQY